MFPMFDEPATESGKLVLVPDELPPTGTMAEFVGVLQVSQGEMHVFSSATQLAKGSSLQRLCISPDSETPGGLHAIGRIVITRPTSILVADPHILYKRWFGARWNRSDERKRAARSVRSGKIACEYVTDWGDDAIALRVGGGTCRYKITREGAGHSLILL